MRRGVVSCVVAALAHAAAGAVSLPAGVRVEWTVSDDVPAQARGPMVREVEQIWSRARLPDAWPQAGAESGEDAPGLRVLVFSRHQSASSTEVWPVGELVRDQAGAAVAIVSVDGARRVLQAAGFGDEPLAMTHRRLGVILGRAVAHEIGHFVLGTSGHAGRGLMRARIDAREFADLREGAFEFDDVPVPRLGWAALRPAATDRAD
jgi:hypothetical protein